MVLPVLLLFGPFPDQLEARASCWCSAVCCFPRILPGSHWLYVRALTNQRCRPAALGFPRSAGRCRSRRTSFSFTGCWSCRDTEGFMILDTGSYPLRVALTLRAPANQRSTNGIGVSTSCGVVPIRGTPVFIPGVSAL